MCLKRSWSHILTLAQRSLCPVGMCLKRSWSHILTLAQRSLCPVGMCLKRSWSHILTLAQRSLCPVGMCLKRSWSHLLGLRHPSLTKAPEVHVLLDTKLEKQVMTVKVDSNLPKWVDPRNAEKVNLFEMKTNFIARLSTTLDTEKSQHKIYVYPVKWLQRFHCRGDFIHDELLLRSYLGKFRHQRKHLKSVWVLIKTRCWLTRRKAKLKRASEINNLVKLRSVEPPPSFQDMAVIPWTPSSLKTTSSPSSSRPPSSETSSSSYSQSSGRFWGSGQMSISSFSSSSLKKSGSASIAGRRAGIVGNFQISEINGERRRRTPPKKKHIQALLNLRGIMKTKSRRRQTTKHKFQLSQRPTHPETQQCRRSTPTRDVDGRSRRPRPPARQWALCLGMWRSSHQQPLSTWGSGRIAPNRETPTPRCIVIIWRKTDNALRAFNPMAMLRA